MGGDRPEQKCGQGGSATPLQGPQETITLRTASGEHSRLKWWGWGSRTTQFSCYQLL